MKFYGIDAAFAIGFLDDDSIYISARSNKKIDVNKIMSELKGGGNTQKERKDKEKEGDFRHYPTHIYKRRR